MTYCEYCMTHPEDTFNKTYHDTEYGFPLQDDNLLFERLILEINQAGLSWITILKKADHFRKAYHGFKIEKVAKYGEKDVNRLLNDVGIIRNRLKVNAAIVNEFLVSTGYLAGAHQEGCPVYKKVASLRPAWMRK